MNYYAVLDVSPDATPEQIKAAYRILVHLLHPDRLQQAPPQVRQYAEERLKKINQAYAVLYDPARRAQYDAAHLRRAAPAETEAEPPPRRRAARRYTDADIKEWLRQQTELEELERAAAQARERHRAAEQEQQAAQARARRAAEQQYPRVREQNHLAALFFAPGLWLPLVPIPAGEFQMGSDPARDPEATRDEQPAHRVYLAEFHIAKYPVTNAHYQVFARATQRPWTLPLGREMHPVAQVSWNDAVAFCKWLHKLTGQAFCLPTEAQWEKAARGPAGYKYPWGEAWEVTRLNGADRTGQTTPVGQYSPDGDSAYGVADMCGNVWEWCADSYAPQIYRRHAGGVRREPVSEQGQGAVVRGGAFDSPPKHLRCARRQWYYTDDTRPNLGFRLALKL